MIIDLSLSDLSLKVVSFLLGKFADREFGKWLSNHENERTFKNIMNAALEKTSEAGFKTRGTGAIDISFLQSSGVFEELWLKLLDLSGDDEIDYTRLVKELRNIYTDKNAVGSNEIKAIEFFVDALKKEIRKESSLKDFLSAKVIHQHDLRLSLIEKKELVREYLTREGENISDDLQENIGKDAHYVEPLIEKYESEKNMSNAEGLKDNLFASENKIKGNENDSFIPVDMNTYFTEGSDHRIVVVADSGLGKTTLLKELFCRLSNNFAWDHPIPIYLTPSQAADCSETHVIEMIIRRLMTCGVRKSKVEDFIDMEFSRGRFLFLIDALDQISDRQKLLGCLEGPGFGNNRVVVTTRPNVWDLEKGHFNNYAYLNIREFDETRWKEYIGEEKIEQIREIADEEFFSVPILLRLLREYWLDDPNRQQRVKNRADLYEKIFKRLLQRQEDIDGLIATGIYPDDFFDVRENLYRLAHDTLAENYFGQFPKSKAKAILGKEELKGMEKRGGILKILETGREMAFRHKSFQEYLSAEYLKSIIEEGNGNFDILQPYMRHPYWEESLRFLAGILPSSKAQILIEKILDIPEEEAFALCRGHLRLAALCVQEIGEEGKSIRNKIINELKKDCENEALKENTIPIFVILNDNESISILCDLLKDEDSGVRERAAEALVELKSEKSVEPLIEALKDEDCYVRSSAAKALGKLKSEKAIDFLIKALKAEDSDVRGNAVFALGKLKSDKAIDLLIEALKAEDSSVRKEAAEALGKLKSDKAIEPLIDALKDKDSDVRGNAAFALGKLKSEKAIDFLIEALKDEDSDMRRSAALALSGLKSEKAIEPLIGALKDEDSSVRRSAAVALGELKSEKAMDFLIEAFKDEDSSVREVAAYTLGKLKSDKAMDFLIEAFKDEDSSVRTGTAFALGKLKSDKAIDLLIEALKDEDSSVRTGAAYTLGDLKSEKAMDFLIGALKDENSSVRAGAAEALGKLKSDKAIEPLIDALKDENSYVQKCAAKALGKLKSDKAIEPLIDALKDEDSYMHRCAANALSNIGIPENRTLLMRYWHDDDHDLDKRLLFKALKSCDLRIRSQLSVKGETNL